jgi:hypothetical protein
MHGKYFTADEIMLAGLYRLHAPNTLGDAGWIQLFGYDQPRATAAVRIFIIFMRNWYFLIHQRLQYWVLMFPRFWNHIKAKLDSYNYIHHNNTDNWPPLFGFIDNVQVETCRPGGGPAVPGQNAPRNDPLIQQAFYNGWKHNHGVKLQTVDLPNGLNYHAFGPVSLRHPDLWTLSESKIDEKLRQAQLGMPVQYQVYGDSAYLAGTYTHIRAIVEVPDHQLRVTRALSACRQCIEWHYGELFTLFSYLDYEHGLKIRKSDVNAHIMAALIMRNAYVCLNGNKTSEFFGLEPPTLEAWVQM